MPIILRGRYLPLRLLGKGGFGAAFLAQDRDIPGMRPCVVKQFLPPEDFSPAALEIARELFNREAEVLSKLGSKNEHIPELFAFFSLTVTDRATNKETEYFYLVQEYVNGENLEEELSRKGRFNEQEVRYVLEEMLNVLQFVHENGSIHRDIKPSNIMRDKNNRLYLLDFGAVKQVSTTGKSPSAVRSTGIFTMGYSPPEQMAATQVYPCTDLYALAATCLCLLTGKTPEDIYDPYQNTWNWQSFAPSTSPELAKVLKSMLQSLPKDRPQSAIEVLNSLRASVPVPKASPDFQYLKTLEGHSESVSSVAITLDGKYIVSGSSDKTIKVWDLTTGKCLKTLEGHKHQVRSVAITPDSKYIVSGSWDKTIKIWEMIAFKIWGLNTGRCLKTLSGHSEYINSVAITPDGKYIVSGSLDKTIKIWEITTGRCLNTLSGHLSYVYSLAITPNGKYIVSGSNDKTIKIWEITTGQCLWTLQGHLSYVYSLTITPNGRFIVSGSNDKTIKIWDLTTVRCLWTLQGHSNDINSLAITPDGKNIISASNDKTIKVWEMTTGKCLWTLQGHSCSVNSVAITPDGKNIVSGRGDKTIKVWGIPE